MTHTFSPRLLFLSAICCFAVALPATAQEYNQRYDDSAKIDRLERDIQILQRQVSRGAPSGGYSTGGGDVSGPAAASLEVRLTEQEDIIRRLQGKLEEVEFKNRSLSERLDLMQKDTDLRFNQMNGTGPGASPKPPAPTPMDIDNDDAAMTDDEAQEQGIDVPLENVKTKKGKPALTESEEGLTASEDSPTIGTLGQPKPPRVDANGDKVFATAAEQYNYAFKLLNQSKYEEAGRSFEKFVAKYPKDPLVGNAYYWLGESHYVQRDYIKSANNFRQGFEASPKGPKAADNLLKLSMSLSAINRSKEACVVLNQLVLKFGKTSTSVKQKAEQEINRIGCK